MKRTRLMILAGAAGLSGLVFCVGPAFAQNASLNTVNSNNTTHTNTNTTTDSLNNNNINSKNNTATGGSVKGSGNSASLAAARQHQSQGNNNGSQTIISNTPSTQTIYNVPNVYAPGLAAAGAEVCLGSVSAGGAGAGFGVSIGGTYVDTECQLRLNARTLATLGYTVAAREEMCLDPQVRAAMLAAGSPCAADMGAHAAPYNALSSQPAYSAPPVQEASAQGCERRYQLFGGWYEVCK
jgi:alkylhydroperoxidase/carboxymuconolactone decarboxylase family protein YurZ